MRVICVSLKFVNVNTVIGLSRVSVVTDPHIYTAFCITRDEITHTEKNLPRSKCVVIPIHIAVLVQDGKGEHDTNPFGLLRRQVEANDRIIRIIRLRLYM